MKLLSLFLVLAVTGSALGHPHPGHLHHSPVNAPAGAAAAGTAAATGKTAGQGQFIFRYLAEESRLPDKAQATLVQAHGGFAVDPRTGEVFFGLKGAGIIWMSNDLKEKRVLPVADKNLLAGNFHNTTILYSAEGKRFLALPDNEKGRILITTDQGKLVTTLTSPTKVNAYYGRGGQFNPTDTEYAAKHLYVADGYSPGNFITLADPWRGQWTGQYFGGKARAREYGRFGTAHGITLNPTTRRLEVADRANARIQSFDLAGTFLGNTTLPAGAMPCDVDFFQGYAVVGCLKGPNRSTPAPFYILDKDGKLLSEVTPKKDFGLSKYTHIHNAAWKPVLGQKGKVSKVYVLTTAWNPGDFAVFEWAR